MTRIPRPAFPSPRRAAAGAAALVLLAAGCSSDTSGSADAATTFTYLVHTEIVTEWDPAASYSGEVVAMQNMYESLTRYDHESEQAEPLLATEWESSDDGLTWTFALRDDVTFHSGNPMTAESVKAAIERTIEMDAGAAYLWDAVEEITAPDEHTVEFQLAYPAALDLIGAASYAAYIYEVPDDLGDFLAASYGTGPYTVESWEAGTEHELDLTAFDDYWGGWSGDHYEQISFRVVPEPSTMAQLMETGEAHYAQSLPPQLLDSLSGDPAIEVVSTPSWQNLFGLFNTDKEPLDDERVRQAIAHALDYEELIAASEGAFVASEGVIPEGLLGHATDLDLRAHDLEEAEGLLDEAGYGPDGDAIELDVTYTEGDDAVEAMATLIESQLDPLGIQLNVEGLPWESGQWPRAQEGDPEDRQDILLMYWWPDDPQPLSWFYNMFRTEDEPFFNLAYYSNPDLDELIDEVGSVTAEDREAAEQMYREMQEILIEDAPALFLGTQVYQRAVAESVDGFADNPMYANVPFVYEFAPTG